MSSNNVPPPPDDEVPTFDESWIRQGPTELSAAERRWEERRARSADLKRRLEADSKVIRSQRRVSKFRSLRQRLRPWIVVLLVIGAATWFAYKQQPNDAAAGAHSPFDRVGPMIGSVDLSNLPPPSESAARVLPVPDPGEASNSYSALLTDRQKPLRFDPCRSIKIVVNRENQPPGGDAVLSGAVDRVRAASGLDLQLEGDTDEPVTADREAFQPDRYGQRWAPVVIWWASPDTAPELAGIIAGYAGPLAVGVVPPLGAPASDEIVSVSGTVTLDAPELDELITDGRPEVARAIVMHELAHVVGLGHVDDPDQIMNPQGGEVTEFAAGDLAGLREAGSGPCQPQM